MKIDSRKGGLSEWFLEEFNKPFEVYVLVCCMHVEMVAVYF